MRRCVFSAMIVVLLLTCSVYAAIAGPVWGEVALGCAATGFQGPTCYWICERYTGDQSICSEDNAWAVYAMQQAYQDSSLP